MHSHTYTAPVHTRKASHLAQPVWALKAKQENLTIMQASPWVLSEQVRPMCVCVCEFEY
jgi:hypothetical protein